ncbi:peptide ABC transporter substrate-binding protein [Staphylococcus massiliensis]|uniref:Peptide ABC transporter substrate-binding protein n=1 Tax=Staphylococcus massiliensis S46 TaxID=1229783 RepID=K9AL43_9STAP|nr:peptide ABC transporter substrate-binding protein [Staphylococcus massiliensis]EKU48083.1 peptide ABC transporter substrate-binding protein [Staphylococcus massiliensis S46]MCG3399979.1 peptide ABC transporter substrate-binding protein [Staphylococcus massiliensis]MCG3401606.1 peptide ABC transporter substrate-binding protein [Staphylococcus massiliensis]MCG3412140.1 peptide ABC transporter substrate-binding protein [Staphylococcus massiliensis]POA01226.1 peptide ABC transporter substrate-b
MKYYKWFSTFIIIMMLMTACGNKESLYDSKGQVYRTVMGSDMHSLDTTKASDQVSFNQFNQVFEGLYRFDKNDKPKPALAKGMPKVTNDGKTYTVKLKQHGKWSNGDDVTAHDFVYAWRKVVDPKNASEYAFIMYDIKNGKDVNESKKALDKLGVKAIDDYTLRIELEKPIPYFTSMLAFPTFFPQNEKVSKKFGDKYATTGDKAVYNGPFKLEEWKPEDKIILAKNEQYWDKEAVHLDKVKYKVIKDPQAGAALYDTDSVDSAGIVAEQVDKYKDNPGLKSRLLVSSAYIKMNQKKVPAFRNKDFRLAIAKSIDKEGFVDTVKNDGSTVNNAFTAKKTAETVDGQDFADTVDSPLKYNPKAAKAHLEKAKKALGKDAFTFSLNTEDTPDTKLAAEYIKGEIEKNLPGVTVKIKQLPFKQRWNNELTMNYESSISLWNPDYPDPISYMDIMTKDHPNNNTGWSSKRYDQLVKDANGKLLQRPKEREAALREAEELMLKEAPIAPIYQKGSTYLENPQVKGRVNHSMGGSTTLKHVYIDKSIDKETGKKKDK